MDIGFGAPVAGRWATPRNLTEFARRAERLGYRSLWTFQRLLVPAAPQVPTVYRSVLDPLVALGYTAAVTSTIRLGVAVVNHPFISPPLLAKQAATIDVLSGGRLDLGIGIGWMPEEFTASGAAMAGRGARTEEYLSAMRVLWSGENGFHGAHYNIPPGRQDPPPVQRPGPPVLLGGLSRAAMQRAGRIADGWVTSGGADLSTIAESAKIVQETAAAAGRGPLRIVCRGAVREGAPVTSPVTGDRRLLSGSFEQIREDTAWLESCGVTEVFYDMNWDPLVGDPAADEDRAVLRASEVLEALAPEGRS
jgi:probable F420-dependent oxidoreductase